MAASFEELSSVNDVLVPFSGYENPDDLAAQMQELVMRSADALTLRGLYGVLERYRDFDAASEKVIKGRDETARGVLGHFVVVDSDRNVRGAASIYPDLPLKRQCIPLPPAFAGPLSRGYHTSGPNIHAWVGNGDPALLSKAYEDLVHKTGVWDTGNRESTPWTIEPDASPLAVHRAIIRGGLQRVESGRFDDAESRRRTPRLSTLYVRKLNNG